MQVAAKYRVPGFLANGIHAGIKENRELDLSLIFSTKPATVAGVFTTNCFKAAPVLLDMERIRSGKAQAVIVNSGVANAATGTQGLSDALAVSQAVSRELGIDDEMVLVASTGVIGRRLPVRKISRAVKKLVTGLHEDGIEDAEKGIMTTDRFPKVAFRSEKIGSCRISLCGIAKGAGMIQPKMATMLAFILTDAVINKDELDRVFRRSVAGTFNSITVDGCMSTNDTAIIMANGMAGNESYKKGSRELLHFEQVLEDLMFELAKSLVRDGEGATKVIEVEVTEALTRHDARRMAYAIANSNLVKTAFFGGDPNWGRIIAAAGSVGIDLPVEKVQLFLGDIPIFANGTQTSRKAAEVVSLMKKNDVRLRFAAGMGKQNWRILTSDLSLDYVKINAHYHT